MEPVEVAERSAIEAVEPHDLEGAIRSRLRARIAVLTRSLDQVILDSYPSPERLHRLHSDLRRLRVEYGLLRRRFPPGPRGHARALDR
ncbi:MAG: hypothetical protein ACREC5_07020, partial [Thermoplasmata archaeon]